MRGFLGGGGIEGTESNIVGTGLTRFHRQMTAVMAGHADLEGRTEQRTGIAHAAIALPQMHTIGTYALGKCRIVIEDEGDIMGRADFL